MAAVSRPETVDPDRAETYLRLRVEAELRRGLGMPRYEPPRERLFRDRALAATVAMLRARQHAAMRRRLRQTRGGGRMAVPPGRLHRFVTATCGRLVLRPVAWLLREQSVWRHRIGRLTWQITSHRRRRRAEAERPASADTGMERIAELADALSAIGVISEGTQARVLEDFRTAIAIRGMTDPGVMFGHLPWRPWARPLPAYTSGPMRAIPVGVVADSDIDGHRGHIYLGALVTDANSATLTFRARFEQQLADWSPATRQHMRVAKARHHRMLTALRNFAATDDLGGSYSVNFSGGGGGEDWRGRLDISPAPPAAARWLDLGLPGAAAPVRILLDTSAPVLTVSSQSLEAAGVADRYLDSCTVEQLQEIRPAEDEEAGDWPGVFGLAADLLAAGVLTVRSPSLARLAAVAGWLKRRLPESLSGVEAGEVPAEWLSLLARAASDDGASGLIPVAVALPVVDGAHCVITELESEPDSMYLQVHAHGWPDPHRYGTGRGDLFRWTARDDVGGWYVSSERGWSYSDGEADMDLRLRPPINPRARELQIVLTGRTAVASVTVPLNWRPTPFTRVPLR